MGLHRTHVIALSRCLSFFFEVMTSFYLAFMFFMFESALADSNIFLDDGDIIASLVTDYEKPVLGEELFSSADESAFTSLPDELLWDAELLSSCYLDGNGQLTLRARNAVCPSVSPTPFIIPTLPSLIDIENTLEGKPSAPEKTRPTSPFLVLETQNLGANEPEYYCNLYVTPYYPPTPFNIPICGSEDLSHGDGKRDYRYRNLYYGRLRKSIQRSPPPNSVTNKILIFFSSSSLRLGMPRVRIFLLRRIRVK